MTKLSTSSTCSKRATGSLRTSPIAGFRDVLIHDYFGVDLDIVCDVALEKVPSLRRELAALLSAMGGDR